MEKLLTVSEVAELTRLSIATIYSYVASKKLDFIKIGTRVVFSPSAIQEWIDKRKVKAIG